MNYILDILQVLGGPITAAQSFINAPILQNPCTVNAVPANMICAGVLIATTPPTGLCTGNMGGGLFCNINNWWELVGVLAHTPGAGCGAINSPGIYMEVRQFNAWINQQFTRTDQTNPGLVV